MVCGSTISKPTGSNKTVFVISKNDPMLCHLYIYLAVVFILLVLSGVELSMI